ncbi:hypothetical protein STRIP9103_09032 [Streptomyces ipomoeae 91-03]|uniref:Uncharacterized protein n=1 Tax=Streptomyces ipomoeae 91-03 TaxID=698759 RepID=L1KTU3_9ACTN|nr:hypothetical protein STRIP9103_09032 [Streptomyces ipomoeae 91-03]
MFRVGGADLQCHGSSAFVSRSCRCTRDGRRTALAGASPHPEDRFVNWRGRARDQRKAGS